MMEERFHPKKRTPIRGIRLKRTSAPVDTLNTDTWYPIQWGGSIMENAMSRNGRIGSLRSEKVAICVGNVQDGSEKDLSQV
jgi:hypothetical protein